MPFGLTNAPAQFQAYINKALTGLVNITCIVYLNNILVFLETEKEHVAHVKEVLQQLREAKLFIKLLKCK
jgi:muramoyltetrapeptide carboxypeptidase LdcA involved in peptidoglycan recycling